MTVPSAQDCLEEDSVPAFRHVGSRRIHPLLPERQPHQLSDMMTMLDDFSMYFAAPRRGGTKS